MTYDIKSSKTISRIIILSHVASLFILLPLFLPIWAYVLLALILMVSAFLSLQTTGAIYLPALDFGGRIVSIKKFRWDSSGVWRIWTVNGLEYEVELLPGSAVYQRLVILNFKTVLSCPVRRRFSLLLTEKQMAANEFRRLRVRLGLEADRATGDSVG